MEYNLVMNIVAVIFYFVGILIAIILIRFLPLGVMWLFIRIKEYDIKARNKKKKL